MCSTYFVLHHSIPIQPYSYYIFVIIVVVDAVIVIIVIIICVRELHDVISVSIPCSVNSYV